MTSRLDGARQVPLAVLLAVLAVATWRWQVGVSRTRRVAIKPEPWEQLKEQFPLPQGPVEPPRLSVDAIEAMVRANPFSPERRRLPAADDGRLPGTDRAPHAAPQPKFVYKGRIHLGTRQRAIVEDVAAHKTYFLEVGQEVAGFKVLDISENRVVLSDEKTHEEVVATLKPSGPALERRGE